MKAAASLRDGLTKTEKLVLEKTNSRARSDEYIAFLQTSLQDWLLENAIQQANLSAVAMKKEALKLAEEKMNQKFKSMEKKTGGASTGGGGKAAKGKKGKRGAANNSEDVIDEIEEDI